MKALYTPCHTQDSICWFIQDGEDRAVFTGDTLFHGGCGRFFEGTPQEMEIALNKTLAALPDDTKVYVGSRILPLTDIYTCPADDSS
jgi:hydroxyacylglutathione hydrolase